MVAHQRGSHEMASWRTESAVAELRPAQHYCQIERPDSSCYSHSRLYAAGHHEKTLGIRRHIKLGLMLLLSPEP